MVFNETLQLPLYTFDANGRPIAQEGNHVEVVGPTPRPGWLIGTIKKETNAPSEPLILLLGDDGTQHFLPQDRIQLEDLNLDSLCSLGPMNPQTGHDCLSTSLWHLLVSQQETGHFSHVSRTAFDEVTAPLGGEEIISRILEKSTGWTDALKRLFNSQDLNAALRKTLGITARETKNLNVLRKEVQNGNKFLLWTRVRGNDLPLVSSSHKNGAPEPLLSNPLAFNWFPRLALAGDGIRTTFDTTKRLLAINKDNRPILYVAKQASPHSKFIT